MYDDASPYSYPGPPLIHDGYAYWFTNENSTSILRRVSLSGDASTTTLAVMADRNAYDLVLDGDRFFWLTCPLDGCTLVTASLDGGSVANSHDVAHLGTRWSRAMAVAGNVCYITVEDDQQDKTIGGIYRTPTEADGGSATPLLRQPLRYPRIAIDRSHIYYTDDSRGVIYRMSIPTSIPDGGFTPEMDGGPEAIVLGQNSIRDIRVDDHFVYWLSITTSGRVGEEIHDYLMRMAK